MSTANLYVATNSLPSISASALVSNSPLRNADQPFSWAVSMLWPGRWSLNGAGVP